MVCSKPIYGESLHVAFLLHPSWRRHLPSLNMVPMSSVVDSLCGMLSMSFLHIPIVCCNAGNSLITTLVSGTPWSRVTTPRLHTVGVCVEALCCVSDT